MMVLWAKREHCKDCVRLLMLAMGEIANLISGSDNERKTESVLEYFFTMKNSRISYKNILIKKIDSKTVGAVCFYDTKDSCMLDEPINRYLKEIGAKFPLENECFGDGIYIDSIAVDEGYRRQGIAEELIDAVCVHAKQNSASYVYLAVLQDKIKTKKYYEKLGFTVQNEIILYGAKFYYMAKNLQK